MREFEMIDELVGQWSTSPHVKIGPGDDAAVLRGGEDTAISTDMLVEDVHFRRIWSEAHDIGRKAVAVNVADIEAMGAQPTAIVIGLAIPTDLSPEWVPGFAAGVRAECERAEISLVGGDLSRSDRIVVSGTAVGALVSDAITRDGAEAGDVVALCGRLGLSSAGLTTLQRGFRSPVAAITEHRCPSVPYGQGRVAAAKGATAMVDVSDGLLADLGHIARRSGVTIDVESAQLEIHDAVERVAAAVGKPPLRFLLAGGEDHALAATFPAGTRLPPGWRRLGTVARGEGMTVDGKAWDDEAGWDHFR